MKEEIIYTNEIGTTLTVRKNVKYAYLKISRIGYSNRGIQIKITDANEVVEKIKDFLKS